MKISTDSRGPMCDFLTKNNAFVPSYEKSKGAKNAEIGLRVSKYLKESGDRRCDNGQCEFDVVYEHFSVEETVFAWIEAYLRKMLH